MIPKIIEELVMGGIEITIEKHDDSNYRYNLNTGTKSHLHLVPLGDNKFKAFMRYDKEEELVDPTMEDLCWLVKDCMYGRDFVNSWWATIMEKYEVLEKVVTTTVTYR